MDHGTTWKILLSAGAMGLAACASSPPPARVTTTASAPATSGGTAFVRYDDGYRDGYHDALVAARTDAANGASSTHAAAEPATPPPNSALTTVSTPAPADADVRLRAEERDVARRGGPIPYDPADPIVHHRRRAHHTH